MQFALLAGMVASSSSALATAYRIIGAELMPSGSPSHVNARVWDKSKGRFVGGRIANIVTGPGGASGTFIDGVLNVTLTTELGDEVTVSMLGDDAFEFEGGMPSPGGHAYQQTNNVTTIMTLPAGGIEQLGSSNYVAPEGDYAVVFSDEYYYPNSTLGANSFGPNPDGSGTFLLTLWGGGPSVNTNKLRLSSDIRLVMSAVPIPAAFLLFGTALLGLFGFRRSRLAN